MYTLYLLIVEPKGDPSWDLRPLVERIRAEDPQARFAVAGLDAASSVLIPPTPVATVDAALAPGSLSGESPMPARDLTSILRFLGAQYPVEALFMVSERVTHQLLPVLPQLPIARARSINGTTLYSAQDTTIGGVPSAAPTPQLWQPRNDSEGSVAKRTNTTAVLVGAAVVVAVVVTAIWLILFRGPTNATAESSPATLPRSASAVDPTPSEEPTTTNPTTEPTASGSPVDPHRPNPAKSRADFRVSPQLPPMPHATVCPATTTVTDPDAVALSIAATKQTSCAFAEQVKRAYSARGHYNGDITISATSPATKKTYLMRCTGDYIVQCIGGTNAHVVVY